jgi:hypothetical protein
VTAAVSWKNLTQEQVDERLKTKNCQHCGKMGTVIFDSDWNVGVCQACVNSGKVPERIR